MNPATTRPGSTAVKQEIKQATDYFQFTSLINKQCTVEQKTEFIKSLWKIAFVDNVVDPQEEYFVRKIASLLYVPHIGFIMATNRVVSEKIARKNKPAIWKNKHDIN